MKVVFFSDAHGVANAVARLFGHADRLRADMLVFLGDALYHGPRNGVPANYDPAGTVELLNSRRGQLLAVRGNCDAEVDQLMLSYPMMAEYSELLLENVRFFLTHGHKWNEQSLPPLGAGAVFVYGHTHVPVDRMHEEGVRLFNPGSISLPKMGYPPSFGFYDGTSLEVLRLSDGEPLAFA